MTTPKGPTNWYANGRTENPSRARESQLPQATQSADLLVVTPSSRSQPTMTERPEVELSTETQTDLWSLLELDNSGRQEETQPSFSLPDDMDVLDGVIGASTLQDLPSATYASLQRPYRTTYKSIDRETRSGEIDFAERIYAIFDLRTRNARYYPLRVLYDSSLDKLSNHIDISAFY